jgi:CheY-like chemotaxis protein
MKDCPRQTGMEVILLAEDEDMVSDVTKRILERSGYTVLTAANGKEALNLYEKERDRISLELVAKPHRHFFNVTMTQASWKKATNILI